MNLFDKIKDLYQRISINDEENTPTTYKRTHENYSKVTACL